MNKCINHLDILDKLPDDIFNNDDKKNIFKKLQDIGENPYHLSTRDLITQINKQLIDKYNGYMKSKKLNTIKVYELTQKLDKYKSKERGIRDILEAAWNHVSNRRNVFVNAFLNRLDEKGKAFKSYITDPDNAMEIMNAFEKILKQGYQHTHVASMAEDFAKMYLEFSDNLYKNALQVGLNAGELTDHLMIQSHDKSKMLAFFSNPLEASSERKRLAEEGLKGKDLYQYLSQQAKQRWINFILPLLDNERSFGDENISDAKKREILESIYDNITRGKIDTQTGMGANGTSRVLHFNSKINLLKYHETYGKGSFWEGLQSTISSSAAKLGRTESLGPRPSETFAELINHATKTQEGLSEKQSNKFNADSLQRKFSSRFKAVMGDGGDPELTLGEKIVNAMNMGNMMSRLGFSVLSSQPDHALLLNRLANTGDSYWRRLGFILQSIVPFSATAIERRSLYKNLHFMFKDSVQHFQSEFSTQDHGWGSKMMMKYFKWNLQIPFDNYLRAMTGQYYGKYLYDTLSKKYENLDSPTKDFLNKYGINEDIHQFLSDHRSIFQIKNRGGYVTPDALDQISDQDWNNFAGKKLAAPELFSTKFNLQQTIADMFYENASYVQISPDQFDRAILKMNELPPMARAGLRAIMTFKWFAFKSLRKTLDDIYLSKTTDKLLPSILQANLSTHGRMIQYLVTSMIMGYLSDAALQLVKTGTIKDPRTMGWHDLLYAFSSPLGLLGTLVSSIDSSKPFSPDQLLGPSVQTATDGINVLKNLFTFDSSGKRLNYHDRVTKSLLQFTDRHVMPHHFLTNQLYYNHVYNPLMGTIDPEYLTKLQKQQERNS